MRKIASTLFFASSLSAFSQDFIAADFTTTEGNFTVSLDYLRAPLAVANFIQLAGKGDDIFETPAVSGIPLISETSHHNRALYQTTDESDTDRRPFALNVQLYQDPETLIETYRVYSGLAIFANGQIIANGTLLGEVATTLVDKPYFQDVTGEDRVRIELIDTDPIQYRITLRYPRPWLDVRDQTVKPAPMYGLLPINRVDTGRRFFAGSMTRDLFENPGYEFQDEILINPTSTVTPFGLPFNSPYIIAMDTLGPNRNGSRFFITSAADPSLNGQFTTFGFVIQDLGRQVVDNIANADTGDDQEPSTPMFITDIAIRRGGSTAVAFFEGVHQASLPGAVEPLCMGFQKDGSQFSLVTPLRPSSQTSLYSSTDLVNFSGGFIVAQAPSTLEASLTDLSTTLLIAPRLFVKGFAADIPEWPSESVELSNSRFVFQANSDGDFGTISLILGQEGIEEDGTGNGIYLGSYSINMRIEQEVFDEDPLIVSSVGSGTFTATYDSSQGPYRGVMSFSNVTGPLNTDELTLHFDSTGYAQRLGLLESQVFRRFFSRTTDPEEDFLSYSGIFQKPQ